MIKRFIDHFFANKINENAANFFYTFHLGIFLITIFLLLFMSGILLVFYYLPVPDMAYKSVLFIEENVFLGKYLRSFHRMLTHFFLVFSALHILRIIFSGVYKQRALNYRYGYMMFLLIIFYAYTGYLLPFDQLSFWATTTGMELIRQLPLGDKLVGMLVPFAVEDKYTLLRFYVLHVVILPILLTFLVSMHMYILRKDKLLLQDEKKINLNEFKKGILKPALIITLVILVLSVVIKSPLGVPADFTTPPNPAKSAWFLLWIQEIVSIRGYLFNILAIIFILYLFLPEISKRGEGYGWFSKDDKPVWIFTLFFTMLIIILTIIAYYFRGPNWSLVF
ncbi:cytochrome b N-terminal domain-containing protein [Deferribacteraceae bacterium V6Fe1]|nr:cytochrome b N-terminal domain-containing protein [Deferribacteraceae bacterium V6Fe1]